LDTISYTLDIDFGGISALLILGVNKLDFQSFMKDRRVSYVKSLGPLNLLITLLNSKIHIPFESIPNFSINLLAPF